MKATTIQERHQQDLQNASRYAFLFPALILLLAANPFFDDDTVGRLLTELSFLIVVLGSVIAIRQRRIVFILSLICAAPSIATPEWGLFEQSTLTEALSLASFTAVVSICVIVIAFDVYKATMVTFGTLLGVCSVYLLIGVLFSLIYTLVYKLDSAAFSGLSDDRGQGLYFSYVTLTTLGYGDITPVSEPARMLAILEAILGQLFVAIMVARLVALQTARLSSDLK